jgi:tetratricopeptide (TPR) repeat protein
MMARNPAVSPRSTMGTSVLQSLLFACCIALVSPVATAEDPHSEISRLLQQSEDLRNSSKFVEGLEAANAALALSRELDNPELLIEAHYQCALHQYHLEHFNRARSHLEIGLTMARLHGIEHLEADLLAASGVVEWKSGQLHDATRWLQSALDIRQQRGDWASMASISNNLGIIQFSLNNHLLAIEHFQTGLEWSDLAPENLRIRGSLLSNLAETLIQLNRPDEAEPHLVASMEIESKLNDPYNTAFTLFNFGELRAAQNRNEEALDYYLKALEIQQQLGKTWACSLTRLRIGEKFYASDASERALPHLEKGLAEAKQLNARTLLRDYAALLQQIHFSMGNLQQSDFYRQLHIWLEDEINSTTAIIPPPAPGKHATDQVDTASIHPALRTATVSVLMVLILLLLFENLRLRRLFKQSAAGDHPAKH